MSNEEWAVAERLARLGKPPGHSLTCGEVIEVLDKRRARRRLATDASSL